MSKEAVVQMLQFAGKNPELQQQLQAAGGFDEVITIGSRYDYQFTEIELQTYLAEQGITIPQSESGELSESDLESVAGGGWLDTVEGWTDNVKINISGW